MTSATSIGSSRGTSRRTGGGALSVKATHNAPQEGEMAGNVSSKDEMSKEILRGNIVYGF